MATMHAGALDAYRPLISPLASRARGSDPVFYSPSGKAGAKGSGSLRPARAAADEGGASTRPGCRGNVMIVRLVPSDKLLRIDE